MPDVTVHLIMAMRPHRRPGHPGGLDHEYPGEGPDLKTAVGMAISTAQEKMRDDYADPVAILHADRSAYLDQTQVMRLVNGETFEAVTGAK